MGKIIDLTGQTFGTLTALEKLPRYRQGKTYYKCSCTCGKEIIIVGSSLTSGHSKSCGCARYRFLSFRTLNHQIYRVWLKIRGRTIDNGWDYKGNYKKYNIKMCPEWRNDFMKFYNWSIENGYKHELLPNGKNKWTIDRINPFGDYEPSNCRWVTMETQADNKINTVYITYNGKKDTLSNWCRKFNLNYHTMSTRYYSGWSGDEMFDTPIRIRRKNQNV